MMTTTPTLDDSIHQLNRAGTTTDLFTLLCERRGWTDDYLAAIDSDEHETLKDLEAMVAALENLRRSAGTITIAPDFDMDGIASGVLGYAGLKELGFDVNLHIPDYRRGHDLTPDDIAEIHRSFPATTCLLTCDGGVNSHDGVRAAQTMGWTVLVTDHHQELEPGSAADITVDPCRLDETYALRGICGAHVLYQVIEAYTVKHQPLKIWPIRLLRLFAGLGTVSDVMPVLYENRQMVRDSLSIARLLRAPAPNTIPNRYGGLDPDPDGLNVGNATLLQLLAAQPGEHAPAYIAAFEGFAVLLKAFAQAGKVRSADDIDEGFYGFYIAPAMNSPRRIGTPLSDCFTVFTSLSPAHKLAAAQRLIANNERRKELVVYHLAELVDGDQPLAPWIYFSSAPAGMYGLLANQLMERSGRPVVVLNRPATPSEPVSGSGRAPGWFEIITALAEHDQFYAIGHQQACGVKLRTAEALDDLVKVLESATLAALLDAGDSTGPVRDLMLGAGPDCDAPLTDVEPLIELVRRLEMLRPFGHGFAEPIFEVVLDSFSVDRIGTEKQHLRLITRTGLACLWWNAAADQYDQLVDFTSRDNVQPLRFLGRLQLNTFRGETRLQVVIADPL